MNQRPVKRFSPLPPRAPPRSHPWLQRLRCSRTPRSPPPSRWSRPRPPAAAAEGAGAEVAEDESLKNDAYTVAAYGDLEKLQRLVEGEGRPVNEPDGGGYHALQWAALNNRVAAAQYILEHGADINAVDHTGQTALHWSAVRGHIQVAELLLKEGAKVDAADLYGYQACNVKSLLHL